MAVRSKFVLIRATLIFVVNHSKEIKIVFFLFNSLSFHGDFSLRKSHKNVDSFLLWNWFKKMMWNLKKFGVSIEYFWLIFLIFVRSFSNRKKKILKLTSTVRVSARAIWNNERKKKTWMNERENVEKQKCLSETEWKCAFISVCWCVRMCVRMCTNEQ